MSSRQDDKMRSNHAKQNNTQIGGVSNVYDLLLCIEIILLTATSSTDKKRHLNTHTKTRRRRRSKRLKRRQIKRAEQVITALTGFSFCTTLT